VKTDKTLVDVLLGCSVKGEKLRPMIIGKIKNLRCMQTFNVENTQVLYRVNKTSWLTAELFNEYCVI
jgi:hypothetical protein